MTTSIGLIESILNVGIFRPPSRSINCSSYIKFVDDISYFIIHPKSKSKTSPYILWSHGNGADLQYLYPILKSVFIRLYEQIGIIAYDYRGYGLSKGICREENCYQDLDKMIEFCIKLGIPSKRLFLVGISLGSGVVVEYVSRNSYKWTTPIILMCPYMSICRILFDPPYMATAYNILLKYVDKFKSIFKIQNIESPIIIYHGLRDELISYKHSLELQKNNPKHTTVILLKDATHDLLNHIDMREIWNICFNFINQDSVDSVDSVDPGSIDPGSIDPESIDPESIDPDPISPKVVKP